MSRKFLIGSAILLMLVGGWFGRRYFQLLRYQATAQQYFVSEFQDGIVGAAGSTNMARQRLAEGNPALAAAMLQGVSYQLEMILYGSGGMSWGWRVNYWSLPVIAQYRQEASILQGELLKGTPGPDVQLRLENLSHDLAVLAQLAGEAGERGLLHQATAEQVYAKWREQALVKLDVP